MEKLNKFLEKAVPMFLFAQAIYALWLIIQSLPYFFLDIVFLIKFSAIVVNVFLLTIIGIGLLLKRRWSLVTYWIFVILPILLAIIQINLIHNYTLIVINAILITSFSIKYWSAWKKQNSINKLPNKFLR